MHTRVYSARLKRGDSLEDRDIIKISLKEIMCEVVD
jgi:hypothetical protein